MGLLLPTTCPVCDRPGPAPCAACRQALSPGGPLGALPPLVGCRALLAYDGPARRVVTRLKYANNRSALAWLGQALANLVDPGARWQVTWAPTTDGRARRRGFDHAELLARSLGHAAGLPVRRLLDRAPGPAQTGRQRDERALGPAFTARRGLAAGRPVLLVDDVVTTGATLRAAATALLAAGSGPVGAVVVAATPRRVPVAGGRPDP